MNIVLENTIGEKISINQNEIEPFTQRTFWDLCQESFTKGVPHVIGVVKIQKGAKKNYYDARHLCKFVFELVISKEGRKVRMKNHTNPINDRLIEGITFYEVTADSATSKIIGTQKEFLESSSFRSRVFNRNDPFDALSINFVFKDNKVSGIKRKTLVPILISLGVLLIITTGCTISILRNSHLTKSISETIEG
ncbi:hypothetical protein NEOKW01_1476 [Nematocida sp. AWRm80]|nr:hypothetical protein NEOKW01_1476 [Nematocida sp. AWRm80]